MNVQAIVKMEFKMNTNKQTRADDKKKIHYQTNWQRHIYSILNWIFNLPMDLTAINAKSWQFQNKSINSRLKKLITIEIVFLFFSFLVGNPISWNKMLLKLVVLVAVVWKQTQNVFNINFVLLI